MHNHFLAIILASPAKHWPALGTPERCRTVVQPWEKQVLVRMRVGHGCQTPVTWIIT